MQTLLSIFRLKCPKCHQGEFLENRPRPIFRLIRVREQCPVCQTRFKIEPSFYYGSMYVAYALGVAVMGALSVLYYLVSPEFSVLQLFMLIVGVLIVLGPYLNAWSKTIWANFFFSYDPSMAKK